MEKKPFLHSGMCSLLVASVIVGGMLMGFTSLSMRATDEATFCASCHIMAEVAWTHSQGAHAKVACNECHVPAALAGALVYKTTSGTRDVYHNTFQGFADVIHATQSTKDVVQENCRRCHAMTTSKVNMEIKPYCIDCHKSVPHKSKKPLSQRMAADV